MNVLLLLIQIAVATPILTVFLWLSARFYVGYGETGFLNPLWIAFLGTVIGAVDGDVAGGVITMFILFFAWLLLIKHFFHADWVKAFRLSILAVMLLIFILYGISWLLSAILNTLYPPGIE